MLSASSVTFLVCYLSSPQKLLLGHLSYTQLVHLLRDLGFDPKSPAGGEVQVREPARGLVATPGAVSVQQLVSGEWRWSQYGAPLQPPVPAWQVLPFHRVLGPLRAPRLSTNGRQHSHKVELSSCYHYSLVLPFIIIFFTLALYSLFHV